MLPQSSGIDKDEALSEVVGFLEACRPRMVDLVEAGIGGSLGEDTFNKCLQVPHDSDCCTHWIMTVRYCTLSKINESAYGIYGIYGLLQ